MDTIITAAIVGGGMSFAIGIALAYFAKRFAVHVDPLVKKVGSLLPQANCGACGYANCEAYAKAIVAGDAEPNKCVPGGDDVAKKIAEAVGKEAGEVKKVLARVLCAGGERCKDSFSYDGIKSCKAALLVDDGQKACSSGCLGFGDCVRVCPFNAIKMESSGLPVVDEKKCTGCGKCVEECLRDVIELVPEKKETWVMCTSKDPAADTRKICPAGCIACRICEKACPVDAIHVEDNVARIDYEKCIDCGECARKCPVKVIRHDRPKQVAVINDECIGCTICAKGCPVKAISGELKKKHTVDETKCVGCGVCVYRCPKRMIEMKDV